MNSDLNEYIVKEYQKLQSEVDQREFLEKIRFLMMARDIEFSAYYSGVCLTEREFYSVADKLYELNNFWMLSDFLYRNRHILFQEAKRKKETQENHNFMEICNFEKDTILSRMFQVMKYPSINCNIINESTECHIPVRRIKAYATTANGGKSVPQIILQGNWVEQCGFEIGCSVRVECYPNKLIILKE